MTTLEVLQGMRSRLATGWTQYAVARNRFGVRVASSSSEACSWCIMGAASATTRNADERSSAYTRLYQSGIRLLTVGEWNDIPGRTQEEVLALIDSAIERVKGEA